MWKIIEVNNETHVVTVCDFADGERMTLTVPQSATRTFADKLAHIKAQTDMRDVVKAKAAVDAKTEVDRLAKAALRNPRIMKAIMILEAIAIIALLMVKHV